MTLYFSPVFGEFAVQRFQEADEYTVYVAFHRKRSRNSVRSRCSHLTHWRTNATWNHILRHFAEI